MVVATFEKCNQINHDSANVCWLFGSGGHELSSLICHEYLSKSFNIA